MTHRFRIIILAFLFSLGTFSASAEDAAQETEKAPLAFDECVEMWPKFMPMITPNQSRGICQCIETEKEKHPLDAEKGEILAGPSGMDNAGPWPNIFEHCIQPALSGQPLPVTPPAAD